MTGFGRVQSDSRFEFIAWQRFAGGRAHNTVGLVLFAVTRDVSCNNLLHSDGITSYTHGHQTLFLLRLKGVASETRIWTWSLELQSTTL